MEGNQLPISIHLEHLVYGKLSLIHDDRNLRLILDHGECGGNRCPCLGDGKRFVPYGDGSTGKRVG